MTAMEMSQLLGNTKQTKLEGQIRQPKLRNSTMAGAKSN